MDLLVIISVILFLLYFQIGVFILLRDHKSKLNQLFFALSLSFSTWSFFYIFVYFAPTVETALYWDSWASIGYALFPAFMVGFKSRLCGFPSSAKKQNIIFSIFLLFGSFFIYANFTEAWMPPSVTREENAWYFYHAPGNLYFVLFYIYIMSATTFTIYSLWRWRERITERSELYQFRFVWYPLIIFFVLAVTIDLILPAIGNKFMPNIGHISSVFWIAGIAVGIIKFQLLGDVKHLVAEQLIDQIREIIIFSDISNKIIRINSFTSEIFQIEGSQLNGVELFEFFEDGHRLEGFLERTHRGFHFGPVNMILISKNGDKIDANLYFFSIRNSYDDVLGCIIYGHDNSETLNLQKEIIVRQHAGQNLRAISEVLETRVIERTLELTSSIKELQVKMTERMRVEEQIKADIAEKEVLINEIHSRVKNNMNVIIALIKTQKRRNIGVAAYAKFNDLAQRVRSLLLVHQNLYLSINYSDVDFASFIRTLANDLLQMYKKQDSVELRLEVTDVFLDVYYAIPLGIVVNELITNSMQHGFSSKYISQNKNKKHILHVRFFAEQTRYEISVSDNGKGFPKKFSLEELTTNGLPLVEILVNDQINGELKIISDNEGTSVDISFQAIK